MSGQERLLFESPSVFQVVTVTENDDGLRSLWFGKDRVRHGAVQVGRVDHLESPYVPVALVGLTLPNELCSILVVGLGAGVIPRYLQAHVPELRIDVVEVDPVVVDVARRFFELRENDKLRVHVTDGRRFLEHCPQRYDAILLDGHGLRGVPSHLSTREFFALTRRATNANGVVVGNVWSGPANRYYDCTIATYQHCFARVYVMDVPSQGNKIVLGLPSEISLARDQVAARARAFSASHRLPLDLAASIGGFSAAEELPVRGSVLCDQCG